MVVLGGRDCGVMKRGNERERFVVAERERGRREQKKNKNRAMIERERKRERERERELGTVGFGWVVFIVARRSKKES